MRSAHQFHDLWIIFSPSSFWLLLLIRGRTRQVERHSCLLQSRFSSLLPEHRIGARNPCRPQYRRAHLNNNPEFGAERWFSRGKRQASPLWYERHGTVNVTGPSVQIHGFSFLYWPGMAAVQPDMTAPLHSMYRSIVVRNLSDEAILPLGSVVPPWMSNFF